MSPRQALPENTILAILLRLYLLKIKRGSRDPVLGGYSWDQPTYGASDQTHCLSHGSRPFGALAQNRGPSCGRHSQAKHTPRNRSRFRSPEIDIANDDTAY